MNHPDCLTALIKLLKSHVFSYVACLSLFRSFWLITIIHLCHYWDDFTTSFFSSELMLFNEWVITLINYLNFTYNQNNLAWKMWEIRTRKTSTCDRPQITACFTFFPSFCCWHIRIYCAYDTVVHFAKWDYMIR